AGYSVSSQALTEIINDNQKTAVSPRTIRWHMNKLGLMDIKKTWLLRDSRLILEKENCPSL
ncbi:MAG: hypothetical protein C4B58_14845, partial [Deltaproteobacteria bacterium]